MAEAHSSPRPVRGMRVTCDQRWEYMRPMGDHRCCERCSKPVLGFTAWGHAEPKAFSAAHPETCGQSRLDRVRPGLKPLPELSRELLRGAFAELAALSLAGASAQQPVTPPATTEQHAATPSTRPGEGGAVAREPEERCWIEKEAPPVASAARKPRYYVSWRFPLIDSARTFRGRLFRIVGCPSFWAITAGARSVLPSAPRRTPR
ncbi:MAG: hypothetical protein ACK4L7_01345 [Flavobacteriales bacterium]